MILILSRTWTPLFGFLITLFLFSRTGWTQDKFIVDYQITYLKKIQSDWEKELKKIDGKLSHSSALSQTDYIQYQRSGKILQNNLKILGSIFDFLQKKKDYFSQHKSFSSCDFFYAEGINIDAYNVELDKVQKLFERLFDGVSFSFQTRPQIMIYKNPSDYTEFEGVPPGVMGHAISARSSKARALIQFVGAENRKFHFISTFDFNNFDIFHHELSHLFLSKFIDPTNLSISDERTSSFLNEGFAENIAATFNEGVYQKRLFPLVENSETNALPHVDQLLNSKTSLQKSGKSTTYFYSEGTLFVRWLSTLPDGFQLIRQLMKCKDDEHESVLKNFQSGHGLERNGFQTYYAWRSRELERLKTFYQGDAGKKLQGDIEEEEKQITESYLKEDEKKPDGPDTQNTGE